MDEYEIDQLLNWYERLEEGLLEFAQHVPLIHDNECQECPSLISYLIDACGLLDSVFKARIKEDPVTVAGTPKAKRDCKIADYALLHAQRLDLPNTRSLMLVSPPRYRIPFEPWHTVISTSTFSALPWWQTYNALKHDLLNNIRKGTLGVTLDGVCALHQVISRSVEMAPMLIRRGWFPRGNYVIAYLVEEWIQKGLLPEAFIVQTKLFAVPVGKGYQFPAAIADLDPITLQCKMEFHEFLGK